MHFNESGVKGTRRNVYGVGRKVCGVGRKVYGVGRKVCGVRYTVCGCVVFGINLLANGLVGRKPVTCIV